MKRIHLHLTDDQIARLHALAERTGLGLAEWVRRAVDTLLEHEDNKKNFETGEEQDVNR